MKITWEFKTIKAKVLGEVRASFNHFTTLPKGRLEVEVVGHSFFHIDPLLEVKEISEEVKEDPAPNQA
jgi:hypothetical protein